MIIALWLFWRAHVDLGLNGQSRLRCAKIMNWSCTGFIDASGIRCMPAIFLFALAQGFLLQNWFAGWAGVVTVALLYLVRTPREEKMMCEFFAIRIAIT